MHKSLHDFHELFEALQFAKVTSDDKSVADAIPLQEINKINESFLSLKDDPQFDIKEFFNKYFKVQQAGDSGFVSDTSMELEQHVKRLWPILTRDKDTLQEGSSLIPLPHPYVVPGGRFNEIYYWDSYFTMVGLKVAKEFQLIRSMVSNFGYLIEQFGFIPNGNRSYFLSRSQPPFFALMVELLASVDGDQVYLEYQTHLEKEYQFWTYKQQNELANGAAGHHVVHIDEYFVQRYYDDDPSPRKEMYATDVEFLEKASRESSEFMADIKAACESGWDFSSRWMKDPHRLDTIETTSIIPVDLNCLLLKLEEVLALSYKLSGPSSLEQSYLQKAQKRKEAILHLHWSGSFFHDFHFVNKQSTSSIHLGAAFPLWMKIASQHQADQVANIIRSQLLKNGGLITTTETTEHQWDAPNGWAPLQYVTAMGLINYGYHDLAHDIMNRWTNLNEEVFQKTGKMLEKYNVVDIDLPTGGGEYPVQDGFGWTNGVYLAFKDMLKNL